MSRKSRRRKRYNRLWYVRFSKKKDNIPIFIYYPVYSFLVMLNFFKKLLEFLILGGVVAGVISSFILIHKYLPVYKEYNNETDLLLAKSSVEDFKINESSIIYDTYGNVLSVLRENADMTYLDYNNIPLDVINAFVAIEDRSFWENSGIDLKGLMRVGYRYFLTKGEEVTGASTITQQLARNKYLTHERSIERKVKEMLLAIKMTDMYTKKDIMEFYVNNICFANGIYGIEGASKAYFNKSVSDLNLREVTFLCAIPQSPEHYNPYNGINNAISRSNKIIGDMLECGFISQKEHDIAMRQQVKIEKPEYTFNDYETTYATDCAIRELMRLNHFEFRYNFSDMDDYQAYRDRYSTEYEKMREKLYTGGYRIYTSLDTSVSNDLQLIVDEQLSFNQDINEETGIYELQGAVTAIDNETGLVIGLVGGRSQDLESEVYSLNRAYQSYRQPGSAIKPLIVYTPALEREYTTHSIVQDISVAQAKKKGVDVQKLTGQVTTLRAAVEKSRNGTAWQVFDYIGAGVGMSYLEQMNFSRICPNDYFNASSLGGFTYGVNTVEMASAFRALAKHGNFVNPTCLTSMLDKNGKELLQEREEIEVYKARAADDMVDVLEGVLIRGTAASLSWGRSSSISAMGKTGTTNDSKDGWFCGSTPYYSVAVWVGFDTPKTVKNMYGSTYPGQIWKNTMLYLTEGLEDAEFVRLEEDESYKERRFPDSYYKYLPGREDWEILGTNYTVGDYRQDRINGEFVQSIIDKIYKLDINSPTFDADIVTLHQTGGSYMGAIYGTSYRKEMETKLNQSVDEMMARKATQIPIIY